MTLVAKIASEIQVPSYQVYVAGQPVQPLSIQIDLGYDVASSSATVVLGEVPDILQMRTELEIWLGYGGITIPRFKGYIDDDGRGWFPFGHQVKASGYSKLMQMKYPVSVAYASQTDTAIADDLASRSGVVNRSIEGAGVTLGTIQDVTLQAGSPPFSLMNLLDQSFGYKTFDISDGVVVRQLVSGQPATTAAFLFTEGVNIIKLDRRQGNVDEIKNRVNVHGLPQENVDQPMGEAVIANPLVPRENPDDLHSDLIETYVIAQTQALRRLAEVNGLPDIVVIDTWGNPYVNPGSTAGLIAPHSGLDTQANYLVKHVTERVDAGGYKARITAERRIGGAGTLLGIRPRALFSYRVSAETFVSGKVYTVTADAGASFDPDGPISDLTYAWANNKNADTGTGPLYTTNFTQAQMDSATPPTITLTVNDADASSAAGTVTKTISITNDPINARILYVAASSRAECTPDGGETWRTWTPGAGTVVSTPEIAATGLGLFGLSNGKLMATEDYLLTAPTEAHDFGSQINWIWVNETDANRVTVLLANGEIWLTNNMGDIASSTWLMLTDLPAAGNAIQESAANQGEFRLATSNQLIITFDSFGSSGELTNLGGGATAKRIATSLFSNYVSGDAGDKVKREDGTAITGITDSNVRGLAHHIRADKLFAGSEAGHTWMKDVGATTFGAKGTMPTSPGQIQHMINDGDNERILYAAAEGGLYKSADEAATWGMLRDYSGAGLDGLMVGRESLTLVNPANDGRRMIVLIRHTDGSPRIGYTDNVFAPTTVWIGASTTGLPSTISDAVFSAFQQDPFDSNIAYVVIDKTALYKNTSWRTSGSTWSLIFDLAAFNTLTGMSQTTLQLANDYGEVALTIAEEGYIGMMCATTPESGSFVRYVHSPDRGDTWVATALSSPAAAPLAIVSQKNANIVWVRGQTGGGSVSAFKSLDGGLIFAASGVEINFPLKYVFPTENNNDSLVLYTFNGTTIERTLDGGVVWAELAGFGSSPMHNLEIASDDRNKLYATQVSGGVTTLWRSDDGGVTDASAVGPAANLFRMATLRANRHYYLGDTGGYVYTSEDHITLTARTGNFTTAVGTPSATGGVHTVTVDTRS